MEYYIHLVKSDTTEKWNLMCGDSSQEFSTKEQLDNFLAQNNISLKMPSENVDWDSLTREEKIEMLLGI